MFSLQGKRILVTGASSGIGEGIARFAAKAGASCLMLCGRDESRLMEAINCIKESYPGTELVPFLGDMNESNTITELCAKLKEKSWPLDGIVFSAGVDKTMPLKLTGEKIMTDLIRINSVMPFETMRLLLKNELVTDGASIIFISSVMGFLGQPGKIAYSASKGALISAAKSLALELAPRRTRVNVLAPGIVETAMTKKIFSMLPEEANRKMLEMHPLGYGQPEDVAASAIFLLCDESKWITGSTMVMDGGYSAH